jgi:glycosyltransferase involved in cell wall biosynthesis
VRIFYAAGPGDVIAAHGHWQRGQQDPSEVSITFSSQVEDFCRARGAEAWIVSSHARRATLRDGPFLLEHRPLPRLSARGGLLHHLGQLAYGVGLWRSARSFRADVAIVDSGSTHPFLLGLFALSGIAVVPVLHNTLWPRGFPPRRLLPRLVLRLDARFWRRVPRAILCVSPECARQVETLTRGRSRPLEPVRAQFRPEYFASVPPPPPAERRPFRILFIGRVNRSKGVFDLLEMAERLEAERPGEVHFEVCGTGPDLGELGRLRSERRLEGAVTLHGWTSLEALRDVYARCHAAIVPTRSSFIEGLAMTAAEAALAGRPVITSPVVPALEVLRPACVEAVTDDPASYVAAIRRLLDDPALYARLCAACPAAAAPFTDRSLGLAAVLERVLPAEV